MMMDWMVSILHSYIDWIVTVFYGPGELLRNLTLVIPMWLAKGFFILYPILLLVWVYNMRESEVKGELPGKRKAIDLRPYVAVSLIGQVFIYLYF